MDLRKGTECVVRELVMPVLRESYEDTLAAADGADLLVSHTLTFTARLVARRRSFPGHPRFFSPSASCRPTICPCCHRRNSWQNSGFWGQPSTGSFSTCRTWTIRSWDEPWHRLRAELGLPPTRANPLFEGQHAPVAGPGTVLEVFAEKQPDWPSQTVVTGFPFYDQDGEEGLPPDLARFLDAGPEPLVFTLGSSAVLDAGRFYEYSAAAASMLDRRAVLLVGKGTVNCPISLPEGVAAFDYAPFSDLFPRAAAIVHQGGIGTTAQAIRSGRPMLVMPYAHDQPDNAERLVRLGVARTVSRHRYTPERAAAELRALLEEPIYARSAATVGEQVRREDGIRTACDDLESLLESPTAAGA